MANTTNLDLEKPLGTDKALVARLNSNSDKIDAWAGTTNQALSTKDNLKMPQVATAAAAWALHTDLQRWSCFVPSSASDLPTSNGYFVESICYSANYGVQIATRDSTSNAEMYMRRINQGNWGAWQQIALKSVEKSSFTGGDIAKMGNMRCVSFRNLSDTIATSGVSLGESAIFNTVAPCVYYDGSANTSGLIYIVGNRLYITNNTLNQVSASYVRGQIMYFV